MIFPVTNRVPSFFVGTRPSTLLSKRLMAVNWPCCRDNAAMPPIGVIRTRFAVRQQAIVWMDLGLLIVIVFAFAFLLLPLPLPLPLQTKNKNCHRTE